MQRHVDPGPTPGNGMSWEQYHKRWDALHQELRERDERQQDILRERDERQQDTLDEIKESLGAVHVRLETLPCDQHKITMSHIATDLESLKARTPDWEAVSKALPIFRPKVVLALLGGFATIVGWEWLERVSMTVEKWLQ